MTAIESAWPKHPGYAIDLMPLNGVGRAHAGDALVAESNRCLVVRESDHRDQLYFPLEDLDRATVVESDHHTICPFKGEASYFSVKTSDDNLDDVGWWYPEPMHEAAGLAGHAAFFANRVEVTGSVPFDDGQEATVRFPVWGTSRDLAGLMDVVATDGGTFLSPTFPDPPIGTFFDMAWHRERRNVIEGGQLLGAAIVAASKSRPGQRVTSAHMAFVKGASFDTPLHLRVDARRSGSTLSTFDITVEQADVLRATGLVMTDVGADDVIRHTVAMPDVPSPAECPRHDFGVLGREVRIVDAGYDQDPDRVGPPELYVWTRFAEAPSSHALHQALLAQATTQYSIGAALRPHAGITESDAHRTLSMGPVNATIAFHDEVDVSQWLLTETRSIWAGRGSSQSQVRVFTTDGRLVASKTVQAIVRAFSRSPEEMGRGYSTAM